MPYRVSSIVLVLSLLSCSQSIVPDRIATVDFNPITKPEPPTDFARLRIEPAWLAVTVGNVAKMRLVGSDSNLAECLTAGQYLGKGTELEVRSPARGAVIDVLCEHDGAVANAQVSFVETPEVPTSDPYGGGVALFKLQRLARFLDDPVGTQRTGLGSLDRKLRVLGAHALPAFPFDRKGTRDYVGLDHWIAIDIPQGTHFYQAVGWIRGDPEIHPESYLPIGPEFLRVAHAEAGSPLGRVTREGAVRTGGTRFRHVMDFELSTKPPRELVAMGAPLAWKSGQGAGTRLAIVDRGVDVENPSVKPNLVAKTSERLGDDVDGNGIPGDEHGTNLAQMTVVHHDGSEESGKPPSLALASTSDVSDADGRGTAIAALAAGADNGKGRLGVAPRAEILVVDIEQDQRSPVWSRAAGAVYATAEGSRVLTCAWGNQKPHWLLHDALLYAEDNCALPVCSATNEGNYPAQWRADWLDAREAGAGAVYDAWTGQTKPDFFRRALRATMLVDANASNTDADLIAPMRSKAGGLSAADAATGLVAGAALLVSAYRPDLEPWVVRDALLVGSTTGEIGGAVRLPATLDLAKNRRRGECRQILDREDLRTVSKPWWDRVKIKAQVGEPDDQEQPPASSR